MSKQVNYASASASASTTEYPADNEVAGLSGLDQVVSEIQATLSTALKTKIGGLFAQYAMYKQTHDAVMQIPAVRNARDRGEEVVVVPPQQQQQLEQALAAEIDALKLQICDLREELRLKDLDLKLKSTNLKLVIEEQALDEPEKQEQEQEEPDSVSSDAKQNAIVINEFDFVDDLSDNADNANEEVEAEDEEEEAVEEEEEVEVEDVSDEVDETPTQVTEEEEVAEEEAEEEDEEEVEEEEEEVAEEDAEEEDEEEVEVIEIEIKGKMYFTTDEQSGIIYERTRDGDIGDEIGKFEGGRPKFNKKQK